MQQKEPNEDLQKTSLLFTSLTTWTTMWPNIWHIYKNTEYFRLQFMSQKMRKS